MKFFNWVHRKFHTNVDYRMVSKKDVVAAEWAERKEKLMRERDTQALLNDDDQVILAGALDGLHDRILSIGTFGLGHVDEYSVYCQEENGNNNEKEEEDDDGDDDDHNDNNNDNDINDQDIEEKNETMLSMPSQVEEDTRNSLALSEIIDSSEIIEEEDEEKTPEKETKKKGERTTLADLFWEEKTAAAVGSAINGKKFESLETSPPGNKKAVYQKKQVKSLAKKLIMPWKGEESRPKAKVQRLLSRMLKRKIHPEVEFKSTDDGGLIGGSNYISCNNNLEVNESLPLLQDGVVRS